LPESLFLRACRREPVERTPIWIMRQAGRYMPEYRALRAKVDFLTSCRTPEIACEITLQPITRLGVDAAILFSDILIPLPGMGVPVEFNPGPKIERPVRTAADVESLRVPDARETTGYVLDAVRLIRRELADRVPLIGFAGAPFTVATYLVEGGGSKSFAAIKKLLFAEPALAHRLLGKCADTIASYLAEQVRAGAQAAMLFDTWAGILSPEDYETFALPYARRVFEAVGAVTEAREGRPHQRAAGGAVAFPAGTEGSPVEAGGDPAAIRAGSEDSQGETRGGPATAPRIYYAGESAGYLDLVPSMGCEVVGLDWRISLDAARRRLGPYLAVQGNLDPTVLLGPPELIEKRAAAVLARARALAGPAQPSWRPGTPADRPAEPGPMRDSTITDGIFQSGETESVQARGCEGFEGGSPAFVGPATGHVFNLGHGILPDTPVEHAQRLVETVHRLTAARAE
jgi:uroporphyrinogen decarboxylase